MSEERFNQIDGRFDRVEQHMERLQNEMRSGFTELSVGTPHSFAAPALASASTAPRSFVRPPSVFGSLTCTRMLKPRPPTRT